VSRSSPPPFPAKASLPLLPVISLLITRRAMAIQPPRATRRLAKHRRTACAGRTSPSRRTTPPWGRPSPWRRCGTESRSAAWATSRRCCTAHQRPQRCHGLSVPWYPAPGLHRGHVCPSCMHSPYAKFRTESVLRQGTRVGPRCSERLPDGSAALGLQESRATLERLKRMAGFESQDFDPLVRRCC